MARIYVPHLALYLERPDGPVIALVELEPHVRIRHERAVLPSSLAT
jgi:hypothetical protein